MSKLTLGSKWKNNNKIYKHKFLNAICREKQLVSSSRIEILDDVENKRGMDFLNALIPRLSHAAGADFSYISREGTLADIYGSTVIAFDQSSRIYNFESEANEFIGKQIGEDDVLRYGVGAYQYLYDDEFFDQSQYQAIISFRINNTARKRIALWSTFFKFPIDDFTGVEALYQSFIGRVSSEIENMQTEQKTYEALEKSRSEQEKYENIAIEKIAAYERLRKSHQRKSHFIARMSHEIQLPLNNILATSQILKSGKATLFQQEQLDTIVELSHRLSIMMEDVSVLSKVETEADLPRQFVHTEQVLDAVFERALEQVSSRPFQLEFHISPDVPRKIGISDRYLQKVALSLLNNALTFTPIGRVSLRAELSKTKKGTLVVSVEDSGIGMSQDFQTKMFKPFTQERSNQTNAVGGFGLGLYLAKEFSDLMGGSLNAVSRVGEGSIFRVSVPFQSAKSLEVSDDSYKAISVGVLNLDGDGDEVLEKLEYLGISAYTINATNSFIKINELRKCDYVIIDITTSLPTSLRFKKLAHQISEQGLQSCVLLPRIDTWETNSYLEEIPVFEKPLLYRDWGELFKKILPSDVLSTSEDVKQQSNRRILLVEDNEFNRDLAMMILEEGGYTVDVATNGREALDFLTQKHRCYRLILMDVQMPVMDGIEATKYIRQSLKIQIPILAVSAGVAVQERQQCDRAGMNDFIPKPMDENFMLHKVDQYIAASN